MSSEVVVAAARGIVAAERSRSPAASARRALLDVIGLNDLSVADRPGWRGRSGSSRRHDAVVMLGVAGATRRGVACTRRGPLGGW